MKKILSNNLLLTILATAFGAAGIVHSITVQDFVWFQRSGSIIVGIGLILLSRTFIIGKDLLPMIKSHETPHNLNSPEHFRTLNQEIPDYVKNNEENKKAVGKYGPLISFIGTIIWGYGDLLNVVVFGVACK